MWKSIKKLIDWNSNWNSVYILYFIFFILEGLVVWEFQAGGTIQIFYMVVKQGPEVTRNEKRRAKNMKKEGSVTFKRLPVSSTTFI